MQDLSLLGMFLHAGPMVKFVMLLLLTFSIGSWYIIFMKFISFITLVMCLLCVFPTHAGQENYHLVSDLH